MEYLFSDIGHQAVQCSDPWNEGIKSYQSQKLSQVTMAESFQATVLGEETQVNSSDLSWEGDRNSGRWKWLERSPGEGNGTPLQYSCLENPMDGAAWWAAVHGVAESWTRLSVFTFTFHFHALEKEMATHSSVLAWRIPGTGEPGGLLSMGSHRVGHNWSDLAAYVYLLLHEY